MEKYHNQNKHRERQPHPTHTKKNLKKRIAFLVLDIVLIAFGVGMLIAGAGVIWVATLSLPDLNTFEQRKVSQSTKIYDRTGQILLYDIHEDIKRTLIPKEELSPLIKKATIAIEDANFYSHIGIEPAAIMRAVLANLTTMDFGQGGSTITQQVIKNALLTKDKTIARKVKEWVLAVKLTKALDKETVLGIYLNESPYGGNIYGVEEASLEYFGKSSKDVTLAQAAYLAALPQAPSFYSPSGPNKARLDARKDLVLKRMFDEHYITEEEYAAAKKEKVVFNPIDGRGIKAPHFVLYVKDLLEKEYGSEAVENGGYKVITTLDYELQKKAEEVVKKAALQNKVDFDAENAALVAIDPKTGHVLTMVGSRDYFDKEIDGNFNVATAQRQPGSAFKPFAYVTAFTKGYTTETALFDVPIEFSIDCNVDGTPKNETANCYHPGNYDDTFRGPMTMRDALAQSINIPAVQTVYLAGVTETLRTAKAMGISTLGNANRYGFSLVLGGGEVSLLEMTSAYGVFSQNGLRNPYTAILSVEDAAGNKLKEFIPQPEQVIDANAAMKINDVLSDNKARAPGYGTASPLYFPGKDVAAKTGTTNSYRDAWIVGYSTGITVGAWAGNNDNRPMQKERTARFIVAPMWNEFMQFALARTPHEKFERAAPEDQSMLRPVLRGVWQGDKTYYTDKNTGGLATEFTPKELRQEHVVTSVHSILHWVDRDNPRGPSPINPAADPQYEYWEYAVRKWAEQNKIADQDPSVINTTPVIIAPTQPPQVLFTTKAGISYARKLPLALTINTISGRPIVRAEYYANGVYIGSSTNHPFSYTFIPEDLEVIQPYNQIRVVVTDSIGNKAEARTDLTISE